MIWSLPDSYLLWMSLWLAGLLACLVLLVRRRQRRRLAGRSLKGVHALLACWMAVAACTAAELATAVFVDQSDSFHMTNISRKWERRHVEPDRKALKFTTGEGILYRDNQEFPRFVKPGVRHLCFLGDSFTFGHGVPDVEDRFSNLVRHQLDEQQPGHWVVSNLADAGKDLQWTEALLQRLYADAAGENINRIDVAVFVLCLNDIEWFNPNRREFYETLNRNKPQFFLFRDTYLFNFLYFRARQFTLPGVRDYLSSVRADYDGPPWEAMRAMLVNVDRMCREHGTDFRVVIFPFLHNLGPEYPFRPVHEKIAAACRAAEIPVLDLDPELTPHVEEGLRVNPFDAHPNERAHQLAAAAIGRWLPSSTASSPLAAPATTAPAGDDTTSNDDATTGEPRPPRDD